MKTILGFLILVILCFSGPLQAVTFEEVCSQSTTMSCNDFESTDFIRYLDNSNCNNDPYLASWPSNNHLPINGSVKYNSNNGEGNRCVYPTRTSEASASGHSLKFRFPWGIGNNPSGSFDAFYGIKQVGNENHFHQVGRGGDIWIRYRVRFTDGLANISKDTQGRYYPIHSGKIANQTQTPMKIIMLNQPGGDNDSIFILEPHSRLITGYGVGGLGSEVFHKYKNRNNGLQISQQSCTLDAAPGFPDGNQTVNLPCKKFQPNTWHTVQIHVFFADNSTLDNGITQVFIDDNPLPSIDAKYVSHDESNFLNQPYKEGPLTAGIDPAYQVRFTLFTTDKWLEQVHTEQAMYIDDLIFSKTKVPVIDGSSQPPDTIAPSEPTDVTIN